ncbi:TonB-dependent receptor [Litoribacter ruber]|uniref:outer membrane beta-barrel family protein n=1 Tax=Litoribacter ruber TaxID=702568 RepID=UPI001BDA776C|nr:outer membrane beta-barrel family protein [Litoribacter ruber]MBT0810777.1 TonB-dependent receptor [Litoribacter ruber]
MKIRKHLLLLAVLSFFGWSASAQQSSDKPSYQISGQLISEGSGEPVSYANVVLFDAEGNNKAGAVADDEGYFFITGFGNGNYKIQASFMGFQTLSKENIQITSERPSVNLGKLELTEESVSLQEVVVQGQRNLIEERVDRTIYNAENDRTTIGGDAADVLRRVPMLSVDLDGNVSLRGSQNIQVLIDNKPSTITASSVADALRQIPADQIKTVEVITSPSAKYDAEGAGGIINIVTKKNNLQGASMNVNSSVGVRGSNLGINANARKGKMGFSLGGFGRAGYNILGSFDNDQFVNNPEGPITRTNQTADTRTNMLMGRYSLGWDYDINKYNWVGASVNFGMFNFRNRQDNLLSNTFQEDELINSILREVSIDNLSNTIDASLNYTRTYDTPSKEFSVMTLFSRNNRVNDFINLNYDPTQAFIASRTLNENSSNNQEFTVQLDYQTPINKNQIVEFGAKNILRQVVSDFRYFTADGSDGEYELIDNAQLNNVFNYNQNVSAAYLSYTLNFLDNYTLKAGTRYEYTVIDADFRDEQQVEIPSYGVLVPSVNISRKLKNGNMLKAAYNRRIQRPSLQFLNPNLQAANPLFVTQGNPLLDPEFTDNFEVGYNTFYKIATINMSAFMRKSTGSIQAIRTPLENNGILTTFENIGSEDAYGLNLFTNFQFSKNFSVNGSVDAFYAVLDNNVPDPLYNSSNEGFVVSGRMFANYNFAESWMLQGFGFMRGRQVQLQGYQGGMYFYGLNLNKQFNEKKGSIGIGADNFLTRGMVINSEINSPTINQTSTTVMRNMNFKVNFTYRIGKMNVAQQSRRKKRSINNEDMKEGESSAPVMNN